MTVVEVASSSSSNGSTHPEVSISAILEGPSLLWVTSTVPRRRQRKPRQMQRRQPRCPRLVLRHSCPDLGYPHPCPKSANMPEHGKSRNHCKAISSEERFRLMRKYVSEMFRAGYEPLRISGEDDAVRNEPCCPLRIVPRILPLVGNTHGTRVERHLKKSPGTRISLGTGLNARGESRNPQCTKWVS